MQIHYADFLPFSMSLIVTAVALLPFILFGPAVNKDMLELSASLLGGRSIHRKHKN